MGSRQQAWCVFAVLGSVLFSASCGSAGNIVAADAVDLVSKDGVEVTPPVDSRDEHDLADPCKGPCGDFECGADPLGCGVSCGVCEVGECSNGYCTCTGSFTVCGDSCCAPGEKCISQGHCCRPNCLGKSCGGDGCGGTCGSCDGPGTCTAAGVCDSVTCGGVVCPMHPQKDFVVFCNSRDYCEYLSFSGDETQSEIFVPPGSFEMGLRAGDCMFEELVDITTICTYAQPSHVVTFAKGYFVGKYEVTIARYRQCILGGLCAEFDESGSICFDSWDDNMQPIYIYDVLPADAPAVCTGREAAADFCFSIGARLPSEAEWEMALRGPEYNAYFPGLDLEHPCGQIACCECGDGRLLPAGASPGDVSATGARDMIGNATERVLDCWHDGYSGAPSDGTPFDWDCESGWLVGRGGAVVTPADRLYPFMRGVRSSSAHGGVGFRCVREL